MYNNNNQKVTEPAEIKPPVVVYGCSECSKLSVCKYNHHFSLLMTQINIDGTLKDEATYIWINELAPYCKAFEAKDNETEI